MDFNSILSNLNDFLYSYLLIALLVLTGLYFTIKTRFVQFRLLPDAFRLVADKKDDDSSVSSFQALTISTASRVGTGNIAGVATAIALGGAGSVFWMWLIAIIGAASAFVESTLAQVYKVKSDDDFVGGPAYYMEKAIGKRWLGVLFAVLLILCFGYGFNALQSNTITSSFAHYAGGSFSSNTIPVITGLVLALLTAYVIFGGVHRIGFITSFIVPAMAIIYILLGAYILVKNFNLLPAAILSIFEGTFDISAIFGGFAGSSVVYGIKRGLFSNEAGMGSAPNAAAAANVSHPAKQGLVQVLSVFLDTLVICSTTAFIILLSGVEGSAELKALPLVQKAISVQLGEVGILFITISIFFFAFSSIVGNYYYAEANLRFIKDNKLTLFIFRLSIVIAVFLGSISGADIVWNMADILMGLMALVNIISILILGNISFKVLDDYITQKKSGKDPVFVAEKIGITNTELWK